MGVDAQALENTTTARKAGFSRDDCLSLNGNIGDGTKAFKYLLKILFTPILCLLAVMVLGCGEPSVETPQSTVPVEELPDQEFWKSPEKPVVIRLTEAGQTKHVIRAGHIRVFRSRKIIEIDNGITVEIFDSKGNNTAMLIADSGTVYENTRDIIARGNVVVSSTDNRRITTEELRWYEKEQKIMTPGFARMVTEDGYEEGYSLESNANLTGYSLKNVQGKVTIQRNLGEQ